MRCCNQKTELYNNSIKKFENAPLEIFVTFKKISNSQKCKTHHPLLLKLPHTHTPNVFITIKNTSIARDGKYAERSKFIMHTFAIWMHHVAITVLIGRLWTIIHHLYL